MRIGGLQKLTLIDYPGKVAATIFTRGCNMRCGYCHNPDLVLAECLTPLISETDMFAFLAKRQSQLQGVVISGGEPTLQPDLVDFIKKIKQLRLAVKLDTNGMRPEILEKIIKQNIVDYYAMDIKTSLDRYPQAIGVDSIQEKIKKSVLLISQSGKPFEFRTTVIKRFCSREDLIKIKKLIGIQTPYRIQAFISGKKIIDPTLLNDSHYSDREIEAFKKEFECLNSLSTVSC